MCEFSLLTVALNPGDKLRGTLESALSQTYQDFELILKDGGSTDGSLEAVADLLADPRIRVITKKDTGIYDAMNQAVQEATGKYVYFLNCGDKLYDETVLEKVAGEIGSLTASEGGAVQTKADGENSLRLVVYGNVLWKEKQSLVTPPAQITGFTCYRNVPCHQACFYDASLCKEKPFETEYKIRGDYEHFLWCHYVGKAREAYVNLTVAEYEGGGFSESKKNVERSKREHREITKKYMSNAELFKYRTIMALTLAPLRTWISENPKVSGVYYRLVAKFYRKR